MRASFTPPSKPLISFSTLSALWTVVFYFFYPYITLHNKNMQFLWLIAALGASCVAAPFNFLGMNGKNMQPV